VMESGTDIEVIYLPYIYSQCVLYRKCKLLVLILGIDTIIGPKPGLRPETKPKSKSLP
jgi:hypothetical protein